MINFTRHPEAACLISLARASNIINNERKSYCIRHKETLESLADILNHHNVHKKYFQELIYPDLQMEGSILFFGDENVLQQLNKAEALYVDGNFKVISNN